MESYIAYKGATWKAGTKTYILQDIWLRHLNGGWEMWVAYEVKWKKRSQFSHGNWLALVQKLKSEGAIVQPGEFVTSLDE